MDLEARLRRVEDLTEIQQLCVNYGKYLDDCDFAAYASLFTEDGELDLRPMGEPLVGREAIRSAMEQSLAGRPHEVVHLIGSPHIELEGDRATAEVTWTVVVHNPEGGGVSIMLTGRHLDELLRDEGRWRFRRRRGVLDLPRQH